MKIKLSLNEIIMEADSIITTSGISPEKLAVAYLKKAQCLYKLAHADVSIDKEKLYRAGVLLGKALDLNSNMPEAIIRFETICCEILETKRSYDDDYCDIAVDMLETDINSSANLPMEEIQKRIDWIKTNEPPNISFTGIIEELLYG